MSATPVPAFENLETSSSVTEIKLSEQRHIWTVNRFSFWQQKPGEAIESPVFGGVRGPKWSISLYPNGESEATKNFISLFLFPSSPSKRNRVHPELKFRFLLLNASHRPVYKAEFIHWKTDGAEVERGNPRFLPRNQSNRFLVDDKLIICCEILIRGDRVDTVSKSRSTSMQPFFPKRKRSLSDDLGSMLSNKKFGNTVIEVSGREFLVCRQILQARSPVFAAMFEHEMEEKKQDRVIICDVEAKVVEEMLTYIYTDQAPNLKTMANDLLLIADRYNLEGLKIMSEEFLSTKLTTGNTVEMLVLADVYSANLLKAFVINFIITNRAYFLGPSVWENTLSLLSEHKNLIAEVTRALCASSSR